MKTLRRPSIWFALALGMSACNDESLSDRGVTVRDSAGITIVENQTPVLDDAVGWQLSAEPTLQIGSLDDPETSFGRISAARTLSDGRIGVIDGMASQVRIFGPDGRFLQALGRKGEGPGEFQAPWSLDVLTGDTLLVFDLLARRAVLFDPEGMLVESPRLQPPYPEGGFFYLARFEDGSWLTSGGKNAMYLGEGAGLIRDAGWVTRLDPEGNSLGNILEFRTTEGLVLPGGMGSMSIRMTRRGFTAAGPGGLVVGFADRFRFEMYDFEGALVRVVHRAGEPIPVTESEIEAELEAARQSSSQFRRDHVQDMEFPDTHPAYDDLRVDLVGNVWMRIHRPGEEEDSATWSVFDREGRWTTDIRIPADLRIMEIGEGHMLVVWSDELDVEHVRRYELTK